MKCELSQCLAVEGDTGADDEQDMQATTLAQKFRVSQLYLKGFDC